jgi:hypothetical protein
VRCVTTGVSQAACDCRFISRRRRVRDRPRPSARTHQQDNRAARPRRADCRRCGRCERGHCASGHRGRRRGVLEHERRNGSPWRLGLRSQPPSGRRRRASPATAAQDAPVAWWLLSCAPLQWGLNVQGLRRAHPCALDWRRLGDSAFGGSADRVGVRSRAKFAGEETLAGALGRPSAYARSPININSPTTPRCIPMPLPKAEISATLARDQAPPGELESNWSSCLFYVLFPHLVEDGDDNDGSRGIRAEIHDAKLRNARPHGQERTSAQR